MGARRHPVKLAAALLLVLLALLPIGGASAVEPDEVLQDAKLEARARRLSAELRCLVCQNQSIDDFQRAARQGPAPHRARAAAGG